MKSIIISFFLFLIVFACLRYLMPGGIVFYQGLVLSLVIALALSIFQLFSGSHNLYASIKDALLLFLLCYSFMFTIPTTVDRAYSVKLLQYIHDAETVDEKDIKKWFAYEFQNSTAVNKRLNEQLITGSIHKTEDNKIRLTTRGHWLHKIFKLVGIVFSC